MRLPSQRRRESPEVLDSRREMRARGVVLRRERGADFWKLYLAPPRPWNFRAQGSLADVTMWFHNWRAEQDAERNAR